MPIRTAVVPLADIFALRHRVLRPGLARATAEFAEDGRSGTFHLAAYEGDAPEVLGCITLFPDPLPGTSATAHRFRGMASAPEARGRGYGAAVLAAATAEAAARGAELLWCNGRLAARGFYERQGFAAMGEEFVIEGVGPHLVFVRKIEP
ncbi:MULTISPECIES: GNAT family N-acetyltransferase [unclassified Streptomyces]|uniref:GNAT family N-acetyltransferase n=1 Tax=Streptomyces johnsoniae TaxID=3075532 RepID=A0ABU2S8A2_9ACTN|nr:MULTISPECIES: GNAT family N-acetyltransferase [unclassified Streptomyces]MDT0443895.1 GNAT family N-acetyltransferase [Streptomyces sp. DSM 41886]ONK14529.1 Acetyltransferase (GNAT) family protein [Streptomyces sp. MP131-18]